ncbi:MAG: PTS sugar transporter subunit IIB [Firmicutes bacterium]|nr:PTS sugar transporter subunit IIB [Bacillota bacterium]
MISFIRVDDRVIHGQIVERWAKEYPCDGIVAVNNKAAKTPILAQAYANATDKRVYVWTVETFLEKLHLILESPRSYFLITKDPIDMATLLVDHRIQTSGVKRVVIGPCSQRENTIFLGKNQFLTKEEGMACQKMVKAGYTVDFALLEETAIGEWKDFKSKFGF